MTDERIVQEQFVLTLTIHLQKVRCLYLYPWKLGLPLLSFQSGDVKTKQLRLYFYNKLNHEALWDVIYKMGYLASPCCLN